MIVADDRCIEPKIDSDVLPPCSKYCLSNSQRIQIRKQPRFFDGKSTSVTHIWRNGQ